jgi:hypothetical protein
MSAEVKPTLRTLTFMSDDATGNERRDALLREDRELKRRREEIRAELEAMGPDAIDAWYQQEYEREYAVNARKAERRRQLRAADEERKRKVDERRARMKRCIERSKSVPMLNGPKTIEHEELVSANDLKKPFQRNYRRF